MVPFYIPSLLLRTWEGSPFFWPPFVLITVSLLFPHGFFFLFRTRTLGMLLKCLLTPDGFFGPLFLAFPQISPLVLSLFLFSLAQAFCFVRSPGGTSFRWRVFIPSSSEAVQARGFERLFSGSVAGWPVRRLPLAPPLTAMIFFILTLLSRLFPPLSCLVLVLPFCFVFFSVWVFPPPRTPFGVLSPPPYYPSFIVLYLLFSPEPFFNAPSF